MPVFDADNPSAFIYNMQMAVQNADSINVSVNPAGTVTVEQINLIVNEIESKINARAPINHAVANTTYGGGNATNYGHVQLSDNYDAVNNNQKAANSVGASAWALQSVKALIGVLNDLNTTVKSTIVGAINELKTTVDSKLNADANAVSATKLLNSRNFRTNLGDTSTAGFDGSADCNPGVTGTLAVANGGTGQTTLAKARNAMGLGDTTGALPVANGGTGQTTLALARNAMGLGNTTGALPIANGGTGKTTAADARSALGVAYGTAAGTVCQGNDSRLSNARTPTSHASTGTGYGAGNASNYGHVKVSDNYTSSAGNASQSVAASSLAVYNTYNAIKNYWHWYSKDDGDVSHRIIYDKACLNKNGIQVWYGRGIAIVILENVNVSMPVSNGNYSICSGLPQRVFGQNPIAAVEVNNGSSARIWWDGNYLFVTAEGTAPGDNRWIVGQLIYPTSW
jgi:hypothetical protein